MAGTSAREPVLIAIDTATEACAVAVVRGDACWTRTEEAPRAHSRRLLPLLDALLEESGVTRREVQGIAYGAGPGGFLGVRLAASVAQALGVAWGVPALPLSTLAILARGAYRRHGAQRVVTALDARMGEVYWGAFEVIGEVTGTGDRIDVHPLMDPCVCPPEDVPSPPGTPVPFGIGRGFAAYAGRLACLPASRDPDALPAAEDLAALARVRWSAGPRLEARSIEPIYLREGVQGVRG